MVIEALVNTNSLRMATEENIAGLGRIQINHSTYPSPPILFRLSSHLSKAISYPLFRASAILQENQVAQERSRRKNTLYFAPNDVVQSPLLPSRPLMTTIQDKMMLDRGVP